MQIIDSTPAALSAALQMYLRNGDVFFDIETAFPGVPRISI